MMDMSVAALVAALLIVTTPPWIPTGIMAVNVLMQGHTLRPKHYLNASAFSLVMHPNCNLVLYNNSTPLLTTELQTQPSGDSSTWSCYAHMQTDGNFVVFQNATGTAKTLWAMDAALDASMNNSFRMVILGHNGSIGMYEANGSGVATARNFIPVADPNAILSRLDYPFSAEFAMRPNHSLEGHPIMPAEYFLSEGSKLQRIDQRCSLLLGRDCSVQSHFSRVRNSSVESVVWHPQVWKSSRGRENCRLGLQRDGRVEIRNFVSGEVYWNSTVTGEKSRTWVLKLNDDDGNVSVHDVFDYRNVLWSSVQGSPTSTTPSDALKWKIVVAVASGVFVLAGIGVGYLFARSRFRDPAERAFRKRLQSSGGKAHEFSVATIKQATELFGHKIGYGGFGDVFYGKLADGQEIAAKVMSAGSHQSKQEFYNEIELLSVVNHKCLVSLLGFACTWKHQMLVYEYMGGGDLRHRLQGERASKNPLSWKQRTRITLQIAEGLEYLHDKCTPAIIHRDVKSSNVLLTSQLVAKMADFGLSKLRTTDQEFATHITTAVKGTPGYLDPEYHERGMLTVKSDVYAFGIVVMEILTGRNQVCIAQEVSEAWSSEQCEDLADPYLAGVFDTDEFVKLVELSLRCVRISGGERPFMHQVVQKLREMGFTPLHESMQRPKGSAAGVDEPATTIGKASESTSDTVPSFSTVSSGTSLSSGSGGWCQADNFGDSRIFAF